MGTGVTLFLTVGSIWMWLNTIYLLEKFKNEMSPLLWICVMIPVSIFGLGILGIMPFVLMYIFYAG